MLKTKWNNYDKRMMSLHKIMKDLKVKNYIGVYLSARGGYSTSILVYTLCKRVSTNDSLYDVRKK
jgi:hypothetical protein